MLMNMYVIRMLGVTVGSC